MLKWEWGKNNSSYVSQKIYYCKKKCYVCRLLMNATVFFSLRYVCVYSLAWKFNTKFKHPDVEGHSGSVRRQLLYRLSWNKLRFTTPNFFWILFIYCGSDIWWCSWCSWAHLYLMFLHLSIFLCVNHSRYKYASCILHENFVIFKCFQTIIQVCSLLYN